MLYVLVPPQVMLRFLSGVDKSIISDLALHDYLKRAPNTARVRFLRAQQLETEKLWGVSPSGKSPVLSGLADVVQSVAPLQLGDAALPATAAGAAASEEAAAGAGDATNDDDDDDDVSACIPDAVCVCVRVCACACVRVLPTVLSVLLRPLLGLARLDCRADECDLWCRACRCKTRSLACSTRCWCRLRSGRRCNFCLILWPMFLRWFVSCFVPRLCACVRACVCRVSAAREYVSSVSDGGRRSRWWLLR